MNTNEARAEYRYYSGLMDGRNPNNPTSVDWDQAFRHLRTGLTFAPGGRYAIVPKASPSTGEDLLEVGCGFGECSAYMAKQLGFRVTGADIFLGPHLTQEQYPGMQFLQFNANNRFPLADASFDVAVAMMVMEHVFEPFDFLRELHRVLKPGATLYLNVPLLSAIQHRMTVLFGGLPTTSSAGWFEKRTWDGGHLHFFTVKTLSALMAACGFRMHTMQAVGRLAGLKTLLPNILAKELSVACERVAWPVQAASETP